MWSRIFPEALKREQSLRRMWVALIKYCLLYGEVYTTPAVKAVACWLSPGNTRTTFWRMLRSGMIPVVMRFRRDTRKRFLDLVSYLDERHKRLMTGPHWYLWALAVEPTYQGQGIGGRLIEPVLTRADERGVPCYLETQLERNVAFYKRRGFEIVWQGEVPQRELMLWTMIREPR